MRIIFIAPVLVAQLLLFGMAAFALTFAPADPDASRWTRSLRMWRILAILELAMSPLAFMEMATGMTQLSWSETVPWVPQIMGQTLAGRLWSWRLVAVALLALVVWMPLQDRMIRVGTLLLSGILIAFVSLTSHAIDRSTPIVVLHFVHQCAAALWLGALASLLLSVREVPDTLAELIPRVSSACAWGVIIIVVSGVLTAFQWLGWNLHLLIDSAYGRTLMGKLATVAPALLLGAHNRYWQVPRVTPRNVPALLIRSVAVECVLLLGVLAWSAILADTPPPH